MYSTTFMYSSRVNNRIPPPISGDSTELSIYIALYFHSPYSEANPTKLKHEDYWAIAWPQPLPRHFA